jgi:glycosyltransferase involved in cell wall biosynthesis
MRVSIAVINYNASKFVERSIRSCQNQFRSDYEIEILVVDDNSTDDSMEILQQFSSSVRIFKNEKNMGAGYNSNLLLSESSGDYFIRVDADDYLSQLAVGTLSLTLTSNPKNSFAYGDLYLVNENGKKIGLIDMSNQDNLIDHGAGILFRTSVLREMGGYDENLRHGEDMDLMLKLLRNNEQGIHLKCPFYRYYRHSNNISSTEGHQNAKSVLREKYNYGNW